VPAAAASATTVTAAVAPRINAVRVTTGATMASAHQPTPTPIPATTRFSTRRDAAGLVKVSHVVTTSATFIVTTNIHRTTATTMPVAIITVRPFGRRVPSTATVADHDDSNTMPLVTTHIWASRRPPL
jgi:hypothetical protein